MENKAFSSQLATTSPPNSSLSSTVPQQPLHSGHSDIPSGSSTGQSSQSHNMKDVVISNPSSGATTHPKPLSRRNSALIENFELADALLNLADIISPEINNIKDNSKKEQSDTSKAEKSPNSPPHIVTKHKDGVSSVNTPGSAASNPNPSSSQPQALEDLRKRANSVLASQITDFIAQDNLQLVHHTIYKALKEQELSNFDASLSTLYSKLLVAFVQGDIDNVLSRWTSEDLFEEKRNSENQKEVMKNNKGENPVDEVDTEVERIIRELAKAECGPGIKPSASETDLGDGLKSTENVEEKEKMKENTNETPSTELNKVVTSEANVQKETDKAPGLVADTTQGHGKGTKETKRTVADDDDPFEKFEPEEKKSVTFKLYEKITQAGVRLENETYRVLAEKFSSRNEPTRALKVLRAYGQENWTTSEYKLAIAMCLQTRPRSITLAERYLRSYGQSQIEVSSRPAESSASSKYLTPLHTATVSEAEKQALWLYYQGQVKSVRWTDCLITYEGTRAQHNESPAILLDLDNAMMEVCLTYQQYEYGWKIYESMTHVNRNSPPIVVSICRHAFFYPQDIDTTNVELLKEWQLKWEARAWAVYMRCQVDPELRSSNVALSSSSLTIHELLEIVAYSPEVQSRFSKINRIYEAIKKENPHGVRDDYLVTPILKFCLENARVLAVNGQHGVTDAEAQHQPTPPSTPMNSIPNGISGLHNSGSPDASAIFTNKAFEIYSELRQITAKAPHAKTHVFHIPIHSHNKSNGSNTDAGHSIAVPSHVSPYTYSLLLQLSLLKGDFATIANICRDIVESDMSISSQEEVLDLVRKVHDRLECSSVDCKWCAEAEAGASRKEKTEDSNKAPAVSEMSVNTQSSVPPVHLPGLSRPSPAHTRSSEIADATEMSEQSTSQSTVSSPAFAPNVSTNRPHNNSNSSPMPSPSFQREPKYDSMPSRPTDVAHSPRSPTTRYMSQGTFHSFSHFNHMKTVDKDWSEEEARELVKHCIKSSLNHSPGQVGVNPQNPLSNSTNAGIGGGAGGALNASNGAPKDPKDIGTPTAPGAGFQLFAKRKMSQGAGGAGM